MRVHMKRSVEIKHPDGSLDKYASNSVFEVDDKLAKEWMEADPIIAWPEDEEMPGPGKMVTPYIIENEPSHDPEYLDGEDTNG